MKEEKIRRLKNEWDNLNCWVKVLIIILICIILISIITGFLWFLKTFWFGDWFNKLFKN